MSIYLVIFQYVADETEENLLKNIMNRFPSIKSDDISQVLYLCSTRSMLLYKSYF